MRVLWVTVRIVLVRAGSYQERALTAELCGPTVLYGGGGRI
jgi:hypothetical protein